MHNLLLSTRVGAWLQGDRQRVSGELRAWDARIRGLHPSSPFACRFFAGRGSHLVFGGGEVCHVPATYGAILTGGNVFRMWSTL